MLQHCRRREALLSARSADHSQTQTSLAHCSHIRHTSLRLQLSLTLSLSPLSLPLSRTLAPENIHPSFLPRNPQDKTISATLLPCSPTSAITVRSLALHKWRLISPTNAQKRQNHHFFITSDRSFSLDTALLYCFVYTPKKVRNSTKIDLALPCV